MQALARQPSRLRRTKEGEETHKNTENSTRRGYYGKHREGKRTAEKGRKERGRERRREEKGQKKKREGVGQEHRRGDKKRQRATR